MLGFTHHGETGSVVVDELLGWFLETLNKDQQEQLYKFFYHYKDLLPRQKQDYFSKHTNNHIIYSFVEHYKYMLLEHKENFSNKLQSYTINMFQQ